MTDKIDPKSKLESAKAHAKDIADQAGETLTAEAEAHTAQARATAAHKADNAAAAARAAAGEFDPNSPQARVAQQIAGTLEGAAHAIRDTDLNQVAAEVTAFARKNPAVFMGGAALLGFTVARFLKSSGPTYATPQTAATAHDPWAGYVDEPSVTPAAPMATPAEAPHTPAAPYINGGSA